MPFTELCIYQVKPQKVEEFEPLKLVFKSHAWYLVAYSKYKNDIRTYRLSRIRFLLVIKGKVSI